MNQAEVIWTLLIVVATLAILAKKVDVPYPVLLVIGGLALGFVPGLPPVQLDPDLVFLFLLPPLLYPAAVMSRTFSVAATIARFLKIAYVATAIRLVIGWLAAHIQRRLDDPPIQMTISLLTPFAAYIPAERLHVSGVLAVVAAGLFLGWRGPQILTSRTRLNLYVFWEMMVFLLNGLVFVLIGLQLPRILHTLSGHSL